VSDPVSRPVTVSRPIEVGFEGNHSVFGDGVVVFVLALGLLAVLGARQARTIPRRILIALSGVVVLGAVLRLLVSPVTQFEAWSWTRISPLAQAVFDGPVLQAIARATGTAFALVDVVSGASFVVAIVTPLLLFVHARYVFRDDRVALAAALFVAILPIHLRFSRSDVAHLQAIASSSLTFVLLYGALLEDSARVRVMCFVALPFASYLTYRVRPENLVYLGLDLAGVAVVASRGVPRRRVAVGIALLLCAAAYAYETFLVTRYGRNLDDGLSIETLRRAVYVATDLGGRNTLLNHRFTPPLLVLLAGVGAWRLVHAGEWRRSLFLSTWLGAFFLVNAYVVAPTAEMQARYHLNLVTPFVFLAAASVPWVIERSRPAAWGLGVVLFASPWVHAPFVAGEGFAEQAEFNLLHGSRDRFDERCAYVEFLPASSGPAERSRFERFRATVPNRSTTVTSIDSPARLRDAAGCLYFLDGLTCATHPGACERFVSGRAATELASVTTRARFYDTVNAGTLTVDVLAQDTQDPSTFPELRFRLLRLDAAPPDGESR